MSPAVPKRLFLAASLLAVAAAGTALAGLTRAEGRHTSRPFQGVKVNGGTVTHSIKGKTHQLTLSDDFKVPDTPAPHWQIVDSAGNSYLLQRLLVKGEPREKLNQTIDVPAYVPDIARVQIWCAFAETLLGEATFDMTIPVMMSKGGETMVRTTSMFQGVKANTGTATFTCSDGMRTLSLSDDFKVPDAPAPHWQLVDSRGNVHLLQRLVIKGDRMNRTIAVPGYVKDIAKVQIWCAYAEVLLGEASFPSPVS
jgi:hypothetical protein